MATILDGHKVRDPHDLHAEIEAQLDLAAEEATRRCKGKADYQSVRQAVSDAYHRLSGEAKLQNFPPILAARLHTRTCAGDELSSTARPRQRISRTCR